LVLRDPHPERGHLEQAVASTAMASGACAAAVAADRRFSPSRRFDHELRSVRALGIELAAELGLAGIRLLTRPDNRPARALYESLGFRGGETLLYQIRVEPREPSF